MKTATMTILTNDFHQTEYRTRKTLDEVRAIADRVAGYTATPAERAWARKVRKALCGSSECRCSGTLGIR